jgi:glycosyltransferase involved in cell wall biosynthesis
MRIVQFLHGDQLGGMEKFCIDLANDLAKEHTVMLLADKIFKKYINDNVYFIELDITKSRNNILYLLKLCRLLKDVSPDIIHVHKQKSIHIMNKLKYCLDIPFIATKHDIQVKKAFYGLDYAVSISDETMKTIQAKNIYKIYNGIPYKEAQKIDLSPKFNIVAIGGLREVKGYDVLLHSVSKLAFPYHLTIVGEGELRKYLTELIKELDIEDKVSLVGFQLNIQDYLYSSDLQIISSRAEGFSLAMIEGIFYSKALISTKVSGCTEILSNDLLYDSKDLMEKINDVYENTERYQQSLNEVKKNYKKRLNIETCMKNHIDIYQQIIEDYKV